MNKHPHYWATILLCWVAVSCGSAFGQVFEEESNLIGRLKTEIAKLRDQLSASNIEIDVLRKQAREFAKNKSKIVRVYALQHVAALEAAKTLTELKLDGEARFSADERTNSLIVSSNDQTQQIVQAVIERLDSKARDTEMTTRSYKVSTSAIEALAEVLNTTLAQSRGRFSYSHNGMLVVQAKERDHARVANLIREFVESEKNAPSRSKTVRVIWLVDGLDNPAKTPRDLEPVIKELEAMGVENLGVASQSLMRTSEGTEFDMKCKASLEKLCDLSIQGMITQENKMTLSIHATERNEANYGGDRGGKRLVTSELATLNTSISFSPAHPVVLGVSPIGKRTSVFVVMVQ